MGLREINIEKLAFNPFTKIGHDSMLITAGKKGNYNTMTAGWGGFGVLWRLNVSTVYIRDHRYTFEFVEREDYYSLCFFGDGYKDALNLCGTKSGRDCDKPKEAGLTPNFSEKAPYFDESSLVFICRKLYREDLKEAAFIDKTLVDFIYPKRDLHRLYVGEIVKVLGV